MTTARRSRSREPIADYHLSEEQLEQMYYYMLLARRLNERSIALHQRFGFQPVGTFSANGRKFGRYWDVAWLERPLIQRL